MEINTERRVGRSTILHLDQAKTRSKIGIYRFEVAPRGAASTNDRSSSCSNTPSRFVNIYYRTDASNARRKEFLSAYGVLCNSHWQVAVLEDNGIDVTTCLC